jgi:transposase-like protein
MLGVTYKTAWFMAHRIREAIRQEVASKLTGTVEVDETYVGGKSQAFGRSTKTKTPVVALVERQGRVVAHPVERVTAKELKGLIRRNVNPNALIMTDELRSYQGIGKEFKGHLTVRHSAGEYAWGPVSTNTVEGFFSLLKRGVVGTFHHVSKQHLARYVDEFSFRWNHRYVSDTERAASALKGISGKRLTYRKRISS